MTTKILMPALSPTMTEGNLSKWIVKVGDKVSAGDILAEIETDKATMEIEAVDEGEVIELLFEEGENSIAVNTPIAYHKKSIRVVINPNPTLGPFSNLLSVLQHLKPDVQIVFLPVDVPLFNATAQKKLFTTNNLIAIPKYQDKKGHPIKINSEFRKVISKRNPTDKDARLDFLIKTRKASEISFIEVTDACCIENLNTPKDWQLFISN